MKDFSSKSFTRYLFLAILSGLTLVSQGEDVKEINGFKLTKLRVEPGDIKSGGVVRDGIPAIDKPKYISLEKADFMKDDDLVLSFTHKETTRAYPLRILVWHEIVNETIAGRPILVTYCPLCGTAMIFDRKVKGKVREFGASGLLYQSDVLMYDRGGESLWSQLRTEAVSGPLSGTGLELLPSEHLTWKAWKQKYLQGEVLSTETGFHGKYNSSAYARYFGSDKTAFPVPHARDELPKKNWVIGVIHEGKADAFPQEMLAREKKAELNGVRISYDADSRLATARDDENRELPTVTVFWFAWQAFHPETVLWKR